MGNEELARKILYAYHVSDPSGALDAIAKVLDEAAPQPCPACRAAVDLAEAYDYWEVYSDDQSQDALAGKQLQYRRLRTQHTPGCPNASGAEGR